MDLNVQNSEILGRYLEVPPGKYFNPGDLLLCEDALVSGPTRGTRREFPTCLGCCRSIPDSKPVPCPSCEWPVCSRACAKIKGHTNGECKYFQRARMTPSNTDFVDIYNLVFIIRCLLLKVTSKIKWGALMNLQSHKEEYPGVSTGGRMKKSSLIHLYNFLNMLLDSDFDLNTISHVIGLIGVNSFGTEGPTPSSNSGGKRYAAILFGKACMMSHHCSPNAMWEIIENGKGNFKIRVTATRVIGPGEAINIQYLDVYRGTLERRRDLKEYYFFDCSCSRCSDPTEFGSYFSAIKCGECLKGNIIPGSNCSMSNWRCDQEDCDTLYQYGGELQRMVEDLKAERKSLFSRFGTDELSPVEELEELLTFYKKIQDSQKLHINHYILFELRNQIAKKISEILKNDGNLDGEANKGLRKKLLMELRRTTLFQLEILDKICPGENRLKGKLCSDLNFCEQEAEDEEEGDSLADLPQFNLFHSN